MSGPSEVVLDQVLMEVKVRHPRLEQDIGFLRISFQHSIHISGHVDIKTAGHSRGSATIADISTLGERPDGDLKFIGQFYFFFLVISNIFRCNNSRRDKHVLSRMWNMSWALLFLSNAIVTLVI